MFHSYVSLPEGIIIYLYCWMWGYRYESTNQWRKEHLWFGQLPDNYHWLVLSWMKQHQWLILFPRSNNRPVMGNQSSNTDFAEMSYGFIVFIVWWSNVIHITLFRVFFFANFNCVCIMFLFLQVPKVWHINNCWMSLALKRSLPSLFPIIFLPNMW